MLGFARDDKTVNGHYRASPSKYCLVRWMAAAAASATGHPAEEGLLDILAGGVLDDRPVGRDRHPRTVASVSRNTRLRAGASAGSRNAGDSATARKRRHSTTGVRAINS
jgi:hypothetical protein